jgi:HEAT repeat protein
VSFSTKTSDELLHQVIVAERDHGPDTDEIRELVRILREKLAVLPFTEVFALIHNSRDLKDDEAYWACVADLHGRTDDGVFELCKVWTKDALPQKRQAAADVLGQLGWSNNYPFKSLSWPILTSLLNDSDTDVLYSALFACGHLGVGDPALLNKFVTNPNASVRFATVHALSQKDDTLSLEGLILLSRDTDRDVRNWATFGLGQMTQTDSIAIRDALLERLTEPDSEIRGEALVGLSKRGDMRALQPLKQELVGEFKGAWCIEAAHELKERSLAPLLIALKERMSPEDISTFGDELDEAIISCSAILADS